MPIYEMVREIQNSCPNNQMRDVSFQEVVTGNPEDYVRSILRGQSIRVHSETHRDGSVEVWADCDGLRQRFSLHLKNPCENRGEN